ncbi:addiction module toxin RelE [Ideonella livida]|uniref:Addiction module toxin RelE n=1 Tax=Ideonella livida TaxID=2707176 RepID=A0A7C9TMQ7_9BURK|nr:addiction module toxin RelE [Ideonella livida]NDY92805.1 addiction module toxin RelE [Ideonella livida]
MARPLRLQFSGALYQRVGHVFQGRDKAVLVEREAHLLELIRHVVLNPVRAGMVNDAADWPWSSHADVLGGPDMAPNWLEVDQLLLAFGSTRKRAVARYVDFVRAGVGVPSVWEGLRGQVFLGSEDFVVALQQGLESADQALMEVPRVQRRRAPLPLAEYAKNPNRDVAMAEAYASGDHSMKAIADHFEVHYATVSRAVRKVEAQRSLQKN